MTDSYVPRRQTPGQLMSRKKKRIFLEVLRRTGQVGEAARAAGWTSTAAAHQQYNRDPDFKREWDLAIDAAADVLEDEAVRRAVNGVDKPVFYKGQIVGYENHRSDQLLMFLLRGARPDKFGDRVNVEGTIKGTFGVAVLPMTAVSSAAWEAVAASHAAAIPQTSQVLDAKATPVSANEAVSTEVRRK